MKIIKLFLFIIALYPLFSYQINSNKFVIEYDYVVPARTEKQLEEKIRKMKETVPEEDLQQKVAASFIANNKPNTTQKKLVCKDKKALYSRQNSQAAPFKIGEHAIFFDLEKQEYLAQSYIMDKPFVVEKEVIELNWTYPNETKQIGAFKAKKAIAQKDTTFFAEVWYTTDLPAFPIENLFGVKGGVVEATFASGEKLNLTNFTTTFSKDDIIEKPSKGKKMLEKEFDEFYKQKIDEINEDARNSRKK